MVLITIVQMRRGLLNYNGHLDASSGKTLSITDRKNLFLMPQSNGKGTRHSRSQSIGVRCPRSDTRPAPVRDGWPLGLFHEQVAQLHPCPATLC